MKPGWMPCSLFLFSAIPLLAGCGNSDRSRLVGKWQIDQVEKISSRVAGEDAEPNGGVEEMSVQFFGSGKLKTETKIGNINSSKTGSWTFKSFQEDPAVMRIECTLGMQTTQHEIEVEDADTIEWIPPNLAGTSQKIRFSRAKN